MQTHLKGFGLENFRVFKDYTWFDFAPITILTGPNSSGKSSLNKALLLMKDNFSYRERGLLPFCKYPIVDNFQIEFDGIDHNLSSGFNAINRNSNNPYISFYYESDVLPLDYRILIKFDHFVEQGPNERIQKSADESNNLSILVSNGKHLTQLVSMSYKNRSFYCNLPVVCKLVEDILHNLDNDLDKISHGFRAYLFNESDRPEEFILKIKNILEQFICYFSRLDWKHNRVALKDLFEPKGPFYESAENLFFDENTDDLEYFHRLMGVKDFLDYGYNINDLFGFLLLNNGCESALEKDNEYDFFTPEVNALTSNFADVIRIILGTFEDNDRKSKEVFISLPYLGEIHYLPSIKGVNERSYRSRDEHILNTLFKIHKNNQTRDLVGTGARKSFYHKWIEKFGLRSLLLERDERLDANFFTIDGLSTVDVGFGLTQIIAVILKILSVAKQNGDPGYSVWFQSTILILEEPEANLHPKYQSMLADLFVEAAETFNIQFIIETHSEYLIRKMQYLTAKKQVKPEDTVIYYFHDPNNIPKDEKQVKKIQILEDGSLSDDFGPGFFDEAANWELELIRLKNSKNRNN